MTELQPQPDLSRELASSYKGRLKEVTRVVLSDQLPDEPVDVLFFHARARGDLDGLFELAAQLVREGKVRNILINGSDGQGFRPGVDIRDDYEAGDYKNTAWEGGAEWARLLNEQVGVDILEHVWFSEPGAHTNQENDAFAKFAKERGWKTAATLTHPHQLVRAMMGQLVSNRNIDYPMKLYAICPEGTDWEEEVHGSQGRENKLRRKHIQDELKRIAAYQVKGDLVSPQELSDYYRRRGGVEIERAPNGRGRNIEVINSEIEDLHDEEI